ncbi:MAG: DUF368 domain-containing protein [Clostridia bacterium]|nr:DUF368 domain-containing protein [Clostridia bacterium]
MKNFFKGIVVGIGGISPGLSGSVMLVIFGLYQKVVDAIGSIFKNFKKNVLFLLPLFLGMGVGIVLFSKITDFFLETFEMQTRYLFLGLVVGTLPLFHKEVKKNGFAKKYYIYIAVAALLGILLFVVNSDLFPRVETPNFLQSVLLGVAVAGSALIPGVDSAVILSSFGLYELWVSSVADLNMTVLIPAAIGVGVGALVISFGMSRLIKRFYTATFSIVFGLFISIIPRVLNESCMPGLNGKTVVSFVLAVVGFVISFYLGDIPKHNAWLKAKFGKKQT